MAEPNFWRYLTDPAVAAPAREFARTRVRPVADHIDTADLYPVDLVAETAEHGWNTMTLPTRYGGGGAPMEHALAVFEELGAGSASLAVSLISIFQSSKIIELYGPDSLRERVLPRYAAGLRASYALTEGGRGSDITSLDTKAHRTDSGWVITGEKAFITSGSKADFFVVLAETDVGVSVFAVEREAPGRVDPRDARGRDVRPAQRPARQPGARRRRAARRRAHRPGGQGPAPGHGHPVQQPHPRGGHLARHRPVRLRRVVRLRAASGPPSAARSSTSRASSGTSRRPPPSSTPPG